MPMNKIPRLREPRGPVVQQVRDLFLEREFKEAPDEFCQEDIKHVENMDFLLQRYVIMQRKDVEASVKMASQMLKWRKEKRVYDLNEKVFPQELTMTGGAFVYEKDKFGNKTLYLRASMCKNCAELKATMKDFLTYLLCQIDDPTEGSTYAIIMDLTNCTLSNYDLDLMMHMVTLLKDHFPVNMDYFLAVNFPWILSAAWSLIKRLIPAEKRDAVQFINSDKIFDFVDKDHCPDFLGGTCTRPYAYLVEGAPSTIDYLAQHATKSIPKKRLREILNLFSQEIPKEHLKRLKAQIETMHDGIKVDENFNNNNNEEPNDKLAANKPDDELKSAKQKKKTAAK